MSAVRRPQPRPEVMAIAPYVGGEAHLPGVSRIIKLSSNEAPSGHPLPRVPPLRTARRA